MPQAETAVSSRVSSRVFALLGGARALFERARREQASPHKIALSVGVGVFAACTPLWGFHMWIALGLATLLRLNRLWAFLASRLSFAPVFLWVTFCEIEVAQRLRTGAWAVLAPKEALAHGPELLADWVLGAGIVGGALGALAGIATYPLALSWRRRAGALRPISESPPSAPRPLDP